ncbi:Carbamoyl-phosphate synthase, small subunit [Syntrophomonas zehnderi OL-4]|uniref:Carbamoyl phosphate synthase small chain n=1 Tax=Syntrophomonas zehnderi OL-4 TaxID=690567 RepID=A0A0E4GDQ3_9FIRM|nr:glutamine-hydrolyzing carbamoyl-phosphate synthase small subunit [Syntrophomonas zehnderi]CFX55782.1 Carbamoyl-phosphate synthase, small subunit [Syntrophomonas zehnderi OL-4]
MAKQRGYLVLENEAVFGGILLDNTYQTRGEVVFNTSMVGYDQVISDPSYAGQIVVMTFPLIGNYGINANNLESDHPCLRALITREICPGADYGHYQQEITLEEYLHYHHIPCLTGVDTRALTKMIRTRGTMGGILVDSLDNKEELLQAARLALQPPPQGYVMQVSRKAVTRLGAGGKRLVLIDFGVKKSIVTALLKQGCEIFIVPASVSAREILAFNPDGVVLSNGPGDPLDCPYAIQTIAELIGRMPIFGICLGHQLLTLALGGKTYKMPFGHRGGNHPVKDMQTGRVFITSQNHGYAVDEKSLCIPGLKLSFINLNDRSVEGIIHKELALMSVQFHPEAAPGPEDTAYLFDDFMAMIA